MRGGPEEEVFGDDRRGKENQVHPETWKEEERLDKNDIKEITGREWRQRIGVMWRRQGGKQLTQQTKMQQAVTEANPVKTEKKSNIRGVIS